MKKTLLVAAASMAALAAGQNTYAQGCVLIREAAPVIGSISSTYMRPGEWQLDVSFRDSTADRHYSLDVEQVQRQQLGTNVINTQKQTLFNISHHRPFEFRGGRARGCRDVGNSASADAGARSPRDRARSGSRRHLRDGTLLGIRSSETRGPKSVGWPWLQSADWKSESVRRLQRQQRSESDEQADRSVD
jgi:hypothetical protein